MRAWPGILVAVSILGAGPSRAEQKALRLVHASLPVRVDGVIDPVWSQADSVEDFVQQSPYHHGPPSHRTVAKVLTTDTDLYCLMMCTEAPGQVDARTGKLDDTGGDVVSIMLDTFGDRQTAYKFAVSAGGARADCRLLDDARNRDYSWDGVWYASSRVSEDRFVVEMRIPYRCLQYDEQLSSWGLDFDRWRPSTGEDLYWCAYEQNEGQRISRFGHLELGDFRPAERGRGLEVYPVGLLSGKDLSSDRRSTEPDVGLDLFYNPSQRLTVQVTANPDFAQIEADPFSFNITRYESHYDERRPFFTEGAEVFRASGQERSSGFYAPLELFYSRRIGRKLPDGTEVPLRLGTRGFGRAGGWEYGGFVAGTGSTDYTADAVPAREPEAFYAAGRARRKVFANSSVGVLAAGRRSQAGDNLVVDLDGALRRTDWQLAYQLAHSYRESVGSDQAASACLRLTRPRYAVAAKGRTIGRRFDVGGIGFVPWQGLSDLVLLAGPRWYFPAGRLQSLSVAGGGSLTYERADRYTDRAVVAVFSADLRPLWGGEIDLSHGRSRDGGVTYTASRANGSVYAMSGPWRVSGFGGVSRTYNFARRYRGVYSWGGAEASWQAADAVFVGASAGTYVEIDPDGRVEEVTWNARPRLTVTPVNDLSLGFYVDLLRRRTTGQLEQVIGGFLFTWQFRPKSWIYLAVNEVQDRDPPDIGQPALRRPLEVRERAAVLKAKVLWYL